MKAEMNKLVNNSRRVLCRVTTKSRCYEAIGPVKRLSNGNLELEVLITSLVGKAAKRRVIDYNIADGSIIPLTSGLGKVPKDFLEGLYIIFNKYQ